MVRYWELAAAPTTAGNESPRGSTETCGPVPPTTVRPNGIGTVFEIEKPGTLTAYTRLTVKLYCPGVVGVPLSNPSLFSDSPGGSPPAAVKP